MAKVCSTRGRRKLDSLGPVFGNLGHPGFRKLFKADEASLRQFVREPYG